MFWRWRRQHWTRRRRRRRHWISQIAFSNREINLRAPNHTRRCIEVDLLGCGKQQSFFDHTFTWKRCFAPAGLMRLLSKLTACIRTNALSSPLDEERHWKRKRGNNCEFRRQSPLEWYWFNYRRFDEGPRRSAISSFSHWHFNSLSSSSFALMSSLSSSLSTMKSKQSLKRIRCGNFLICSRKWFASTQSTEK